MAEHRSEKPGVGSSILPLATNRSVWTIRAARAAVLAIVGYSRPMSKRIDTAVGSLTLRPDGILHVVIDCTVPPTAELAAKFVAARTELVGTEPPPVLIEIVRQPYTERAVRTLFMEAMTPPPCRAVVVSDPTLILLFRTYEMVAPTPVPTEIFPTVEAALVWIRQRESNA